LAEAPTAFFSYSREDSEFVLRLAADLKATGANIWLDQLDITPGQRWAHAVQDALNNCQRLLVILSPASVNSTNVDDEVTFGLEEHKTVIPVFYRDCKVPFQLRPFEYVDFRTDYDRGLKTLLTTLGVEHQAAVVGSATVSTVPKDAVAAVSDADGRKRAAEQERLEPEKERPASEQASKPSAKPSPLFPYRTPAWAKVAIPACVMLIVALVLYWAFSQPRSSKQTAGTQEERAQVATSNPPLLTSQSVWVVGHYVMLHSEDGGANWKSQTSRTTANLASVVFATPQSGWAVGNQGTILHTEDGGVKWNRQNSGMSEGYWLHSVAFATPQSGWAVEVTLLPRRSAGSYTPRTADACGRTRTAAPRGSSDL
jgi:TIR domain/Photosynthesis system II assembly factor YCF48